MSRTFRGGRLLLPLLALPLVLGSQSVAATAPASLPFEGGLPLALDAMRQLATDSRENKQKKKTRGRKRTTKPKPGLPIDLGKDGRLTVLLIGSDWRPAGGGERTDVMMVATIDPVTGRAAVVSIPRDMAFIPLAGGGDSGATRVNSLYLLRYKRRDLGHADLDRKALDKLSRDVGRFLGTRIDYWAYTRFDTFRSLINGLGGVRVDVDDEVVDSSYHHGGSRGVWFPPQDAYRLRGDPKCKPRPKKCRSALVYARSRKGTHGGRPNSDYRRSERQQELVASAIRQTARRYGSGLSMLGLMLRVRGDVETNIPTTAESAAQLFAILERMRLRQRDMIVLEPGPFAFAAAGSAIRPNVANVRSWVDDRFYDVRKRERKKAREAAAAAEDDASQPPVTGAG